MTRTNPQWIVKGKNGINSLTLMQDAPLRPLGPKDVLVKFKAASVNYRDIIITQGQYPFATADGVVPGVDRAGVVEEVGSSVTLFSQNDRVMTLYSPGHQGGFLNWRVVDTSLGAGVDGVFRHYGIFEETGLVKIPSGLSFAEASTLPCCGLTAWNALFGLPGRTLKAGDSVLVQGTGGVSMFAIQFALAAGATVIATTSSDAKMQMLKEIGVHHTINYNKDPNCGMTARELTHDGEGVDQVVLIAGLKTVPQSLKAVRMEGLVNMIGFLGDNYDMFVEKPSAKQQPSFAKAWVKGCVLRNGLVGSRLQFEDMNRAIEVNKIKPMIDPKAFEFEELKEAYHYLWDQKHVGKVVVRIHEE